MRPPHINVLYKRAAISVGDDDNDNGGRPPLSATDTNASTQESSTSSATSASSTNVGIEISVGQTSRSTSASSSSSSSSSSRSSSSSSSSTALSSRTSAVVHGGSTSYVTNVVTIGAPSGSSSSSASAAPSSSDGPGAGMVVGVVAGSLVGIVVIAGLLGYFFKSKFGRDKGDEIDDAVFNKNDFRHESILLQDDDVDRISMRSGSALGSLNAAGMGRTIPGLQRQNTADPRPPSTFERHVYNASPASPHFPGAPPMPSFQPGQIVNTNFYHQAPSNYTAPEGGWGVAVSYANANQNHLQPGYGGSGALDRQASVSSHYEGQYADLNRQASYSSPLTSSYRAANEHDYPPQNQSGRSGSPVDVNPQQFYEGSGGPGQTRQLSVRNPVRDSDGAYDGMGF